MLRICWKFLPCELLEGVKMSNPSNPLLNLLPSSRKRKKNKSSSNLLKLLHPNSQVIILPRQGNVKLSAKNKLACSQSKHPSRLKRRLKVAPPPKFVKDWTWAASLQPQNRLMTLKSSQGYQTPRQNLFNFSVWGHYLQESKNLIRHQNIWTAQDWLQNIWHLKPQKGAH